MGSVKVLTLTQPWATLVVTGRKRYETRSWRPPDFILGRRVAIHAAKGFPSWARDAAIEFGFVPDALPLGAVIGSVVIHGWHPTETVDVDDEERRYGDYSRGRYAWILGDPKQRDEPAPARGALGFWSWTPPAIAPTSVGGTDG